MKLNAAIKNMTTKIADVLSLNDPSVYIYGSYVLDDFQYGWSDIGQHRTNNAPLP